MMLEAITANAGETRGYRDGIERRVCFDTGPRRVNGLTRLKLTAINRLRSVPGTTGKNEVLEMRASAHTVPGY